MLEGVEHSPEPKTHRSLTSTKLLPWLPRIPLVALILHIFCITGTIIVVYTSNRQEVGRWISHVPSIQPSVLLAILSGVSNVSLGLLLSTGVATAWWRSARR
jgi:hypothetical protein